jgi:hypothetical protein
MCTETGGDVKRRELSKRTSGAAAVALAPRRIAN